MWVRGTGFSRSVHCPVVGRSGQSGAGLGKSSPPGTGEAEGWGTTGSPTGSASLYSPVNWLLIYGYCLFIYCIHWSHYISLGGGGLILWIVIFSINEFTIHFSLKKIAPSFWHFNVKRKPSLDHFFHFLTLVHLKLQITLYLLHEYVSFKLNNVKSLIHVFMGAQFSWISKIPITHE